MHSSNSAVFIVRFDRRLPSVTQITRKHWRTMVQDLAEPSLKVYTRPQTIRDKIRAKVPPAKSNSRRVIPGMHKCGKNCEICPYVNPTRGRGGRFLVHFSDPIDPNKFDFSQIGLKMGFYSIFVVGGTKIRIRKCVFLAFFGLK